MDREHVKGAADKAKGAIKEGAGKLTGGKAVSYTHLTLPTNREV